MMPEKNKEFSIEELLDTNSFIVDETDKENMVSNELLDEDSLTDILNEFVKISANEFITPDIYKSIVNKWYIPKDYQKYLSEFVVGINKEKRVDSKLEYQEIDKQQGDSFDSKISRDFKRFYCAPNQEELKLYKKREYYLKEHGSLPKPEEITDINILYVYIQKQFRSKARKMEMITEDDIIYITSEWNLMPSQLIKVTQIATYINAKTQAQKDEEQLVNNVKERYTYHNVVLNEREIDIFVAREKAAQKYLKRPNFSEVAELCKKYTAMQVRQIFVNYFVRIYGNGSDFLLAPYIDRIQKEKEYWSLTDDDVATIRRGWDQVLDNYILNKQGLYTFQNHKYDLLIRKNESIYLSTGKIPSAAILGDLLCVEESVLRKMIIDLIKSMSFSKLEELRRITERWDLTDSEKRKIEFDADVGYEETIDLNKTKSLMERIIKTVNELKAQEDDLSYYSDKTIVFLSVDESQGVSITGPTEELKATTAMGGENVDFYWVEDDKSSYLLIKGIKEGISIITIENSVNSSIMHIYVIVH